MYRRHDDMSSHDHSSMSGMDENGRMDASAMNMVFFSGTSTPLLSSMWTPQNEAQYAGTCIFLIILAFIYRGSFTFKSFLERKWLARALKRRYIVVAGRQPAAERLSLDSESKQAILMTNGVEERVRVVTQPAHQFQPWRFSVDLPRALLVTVMVGVGYLIMLAVMTMNLGYFLSILGGAFLGEIVFGRFMDFETHH